MTVYPFLFKSGTDSINMNSTLAKSAEAGGTIGKMSALSKLLSVASETWNLSKIFCHSRFASNFAVLRNSSKKNYKMSTHWKLGHQKFYTDPENLSKISLATYKSSQKLHALSTRIPIITETRSLLFLVAVTDQNHVNTKIKIFWHTNELKKLISKVFRFRRRLFQNKNIQAVVGVFSFPWNCPWHADFMLQSQ